MRAQHGVHPRGPLDDASAHLLGQAPADGDLHAGPFAFDGGELAEVPEQAGGGVLPDAARVDDDDVRAFVPGVGRPGGLLGDEGDGAVASLLQEARQAFGVVDVHLASEGADGVGPGKLW